MDVRALPQRRPAKQPPEPTGGASETCGSSPRGSRRPDRRPVLDEAICSDDLGRGVD